MLNVTYPLRASIFSLLDGNINRSGVIPVHDAYALINEDTPYIILGSTSESNDPNKVHFGTRVVQTIDVVTSYPITSTAGRYESDMIENEVLKILLPTVGYSGEVFDLGDNFQCVRAEKVNSTPIDEMNDTTKVFRKVIQIQFTIKQIKNG